MKTKSLFQRMILALGSMMPGMIFLVLTRQAEANPTGMTVQSGNASATTSGSRLTVTAGNNAVLNWQSFNIAPGETTVFHQPSAASVVWNRVNDPNPSAIYGTLQANGIVVLLNSSGFYFGPNSFVSAAGLVVSTANCTPPQNTGGGWEFNGPPPLASIINYGEIKIGQSGSCYLIADQVENHGTIETPGGSTGLAAGQTVSLSERPDGRGMSMKVTLPLGSVNNYGTLLADAGTISLNAKVVNQDGFIQANSVQNVNGVIELVAGDQLNLGANSQISAQGDSSAGGSAGGTVTLKSANSFSDITGSEISVAGGANGGNGGTVEISAPAMPAIHSAIDGTAQAGFKGGQMLLDPDYIYIGNSGSDSVDPSGTVAVDSNPGDTLNLSVNNAFKGFSQIDLQAYYDIILLNNTQWNLSQSTGQNTGQLILEAGQNIIFGNSTALYDKNSWSISMYAGVTTFGDTPTVSPGAGSIYLNANDPINFVVFPTNPNGYVQTASGNITMVAGQDITVGTGRVTTTAGGSIMAHALMGNIDTGDYLRGQYPQGYKFRITDTLSSAYYVDPAALVGGISTTAGGNVTLIAGGDVNSILPSEGAYYYEGSPVSDDSQDSDIMTAGSGAYGTTQHGDFTVVAGGNVTGYYLVANGTGSIYAGVEMDANGNPKTAAGNYVVGNTGNAGFSFNDTDPITGNPGTPIALGLISGKWNVTAGNSINLEEVNNPNGDYNTKQDAVTHQFDYVSTDSVNLTAGNQVVLGGTSGTLARLDGLDSLQVPVIFPGLLNITAGAGGVVLTGDSTYNSLTLFPSTTGGLKLTTTAGGSLTSQGAGLFELIVSDSGNNAYTDGTAGIFSLDDHKSTPVHLNSETPLTLNIAGNMDDVLLSAPEAAQVTVGGNMVDSRFIGMNLASGDVTSITVGGDIINAPTSDGFGYSIGGGGSFDITAKDIDLSTTAGILSWGVGLYNIAGVYPLASTFDTGANINVVTTGNLDMTSSSIASYNGGSISVFAGGDIAAGSESAVTALGARGIYTTAQGDVSVIADGNIDVNGSRIATYDGGNVTVESLNGNINAGSGGAGFVVISSFTVDPKTQAVTSYSPTIPGSGILATTFPSDKKQVVGNILVETPNGDINASAGGIIQSPLNTAKGNRDAEVEVLAGYELQDGHGKAVSAADISSGTVVRKSDNRNINATGSGIIGENVIGEATGIFKGVVFGQGRVDLTAPQFSSLTVLGQQVSATGNLGAGDELIGTQSVTTSGGDSGATVLSQNANGGGSSFAQGTVANATSSAASSSDAAAATQAATQASYNPDDELNKKKPIALARKVSRVTVLLPGQN